MNSAAKIRAIVLTCDRYRAITEHMILRYAQIWPEHPFVFHVPYQKLRGTQTNRITYLQTPAPVKATVLRLLEGLGDEEWIYWCLDDKYPIQLVTQKIAQLITDAMGTPDMSGILFCRCRRTLDEPKLTLLPGERINSFGDIYLERKAWYQIWIHQLLRVKVLRYFFNHMPDELSSAKVMDVLKRDLAKLPEHRLFVTKENFAVFGESTSRGKITQNCYESIRASGIELPEWFQQPNGEYVTLGKL
jgi:hypothetical protein